MIRIIWTTIKIMLNLTKRQFGPLCQNFPKFPKNEEKVFIIDYEADRYWPDQFDRPRNNIQK